MPWLQRPAVAQSLPPSNCLRGRRAGELLKKGNGMYQVQCASGAAAQASQAMPQRKRRAP